MAQLNAAATQGCLLPALDPVAQAPVVETAVDPVAMGVPQEAADPPRDLIIAQALAAGLDVSGASAKDVLPGSKVLLAISA